MIMDDPGQAVFEADPADGFRITFVLRPGEGRNERVPLMSIRLFEDDKMRAVAVWLGERQELWPEWRRIAETEGGEFLAARIVEMMMVDAQHRFGSAGFLCEEWLASSAASGDGSSVDLFARMTTREILIISHDFEDGPSVDAFFNSLTASRSGLDEVDRIAILALLEGRNAAARRLDAVAAAHLRGHGATMH